jgi:hypothetical protein
VVRGAAVGSHVPLEAVACRHSRDIRGTAERTVVLSPATPLPSLPWPARLTSASAACSASSGGASTPPAAAATRSPGCSLTHKPEDTTSTPCWSRRSAAGTGKTTRGPRPVPPRRRRPAPPCQGPDRRRRIQGHRQLRTAAIGCRPGRRQQYGTGQHQPGRHPPQKPRSNADRFVTARQTDRSSTADHLAAQPRRRGRSQRIRPTRCMYCGPHLHGWISGKDNVTRSRGELLTPRII